MAGKFLLDVGMASLFIWLLRYFSKQRDSKSLQRKLNDQSKKRLKKESIITTVFAVFYIIRVLIMDIGYQVLVILYFFNQENSNPVLEEI